jgi:hypothetical protein
MGWTTEVRLPATVCRPALEPAYRPIQWVPGLLLSGVKRLERQADHLPPSSAEVKNVWSYTTLPPYVFMAWCLMKHRINLHGMVVSQVQGQLYIYLYVT